jgi:hypothetical protein
MLRPHIFIGCCLIRRHGFGAAERPAINQDADNYYEYPFRQFRGIDKSGATTSACRRR